jgi:DNA-binding transcriptional MerR regulator/methylmalonyl-CoA mutase cobalamin-binding subunit
MPKAPSIAPTLHPVRMVVQRTGLTPDLLRAWERRYGVVKPTRTAGGQRLYSDADVARLSVLKRAVEGGRTISQVAPLDDAAIRAMIDADLAAARAQPLRAVPFATDDGDSVLAAALKAVDEFDGPVLEQQLRAAALRFSVDAMLDEVLSPLLFTIGSLWHAGALDPANEHMATATIRRVLGWMMDQSAMGVGAPTIVVATPTGQTHEMGAMLVAATVAARGWRVVYLGADLPATEIANAAVRTRARAVAISIVYPLDDGRLAGELQRLRDALPAQMPVVVGGSGAAAYSDAIAKAALIPVGTLPALREWLRSGGNA